MCVGGWVGEEVTSLYSHHVLSPSGHNNYGEDDKIIYYFKNVNCSCQVASLS